MQERASWPRAFSEAVLLPCLSSEGSLGLGGVGMEKGSSISLFACAVLALWQKHVTWMPKQALVVPLLDLHRPHKTWYRSPLSDSGQKCFSNYW